MEGEIINLFAYNEKISFSQIQKLVKVRSNLLAYHLSKLIQKKVLVKVQHEYAIAPESEYLIPYVSSKVAVIPVILIHIGDEKEAFLIKRVKRPYKGLYGLPGGRLLVGESYKQAAQRIMREKGNKEIRNVLLKKIILEHIKQKEKIINSFLLIIMKAKVSEIELMNIKRNKKRIIASDYKIIAKEKINEEIIVSKL